jgi:hypothetical protein
MAAKYQGFIHKDTGKKDENGKPKMIKYGETKIATEKEVDDWIKETIEKIPEDSGYTLTKIRIVE